MPRPIVNLDALQYDRWNKGFPPDQQPPQERFGADRAEVGKTIGARKLGYNVTAVDPGKAAFPAHSHRINEEMFMVLEGEGEVRIGPDRYPVRAGDIIACPPGGPATAHQLRNTGTGPFRFLAISTVEGVDIVEYPDSGKTSFGAMSQGPDGKPQFVRGIVRNDQQPKYWEGE